MTLPLSLSCGLHHGVSAKDYRADPCEAPSLSSTMARTMLFRSPAHVLAETPRLGGTGRKSTPSMEDGTLVHSVLSNDLTEYAFGEFPTLKAAGAKKWQEKVIAEGKTPCLVGDFEAAKTVAKNIMELAADSVTTRSPFSSEAKQEVTAIWQDGSVYCRARFDVLVTDEYKNADIWDWKKTKDITDRGIQKAIQNYRYDVQAAFYLHGLEKQGFERQQTSFTFVFFEMDPPYTVRRAVISAEWMNQARKEVSRAIALWQKCLAEKAFARIPPDTLFVEIPQFLSENTGEVIID